MSDPTLHKRGKTPNNFLIGSGVFLLVLAFLQYHSNSDPGPARTLTALGLIIMFIGYHALPRTAPDEASAADQEKAPEAPPATATIAGPGSESTDESSPSEDKEALKEKIELRCNCIIVGQIIAAMILAMGLTSNSNNMYNTIVLVIVSGFGYLGISLIGNGYLISKSHIHYAYALIGVLGYFATPVVFMLGQ